MKYNSKHKYNKNGSLNIHYKYNIRYVGIDTNNRFHVKLFKHRRNIEKQGYKYKGKMHKWIYVSVRKQDITPIKEIHRPKFKLFINQIYFANQEGKGKTYVI